MNKKKVRAIALYLPQFHPTPHNDLWWGKGFTEWTNVCKAQKLFHGHEQPHVPADLGFYDLRLPESRRAQAQMAQKYGIEGFCYYHYWFGEGRRELELPFDQVLASGQPDFPFMLCWANESWHCKFWNSEGIARKEVLAEQRYDDDKGQEDHFQYLYRAFSDRRYLQYDGKPMFLIYKPLNIPSVEQLLAKWNAMAMERGLNGICFIAYSTNIAAEKTQLLSLGFDAVVADRLQQTLFRRKGISKLWHRALRKLFSRPFVFDYSKIYRQFTGRDESADNVIPLIIPNWDHTPRSGKYGFAVSNATPANFEKHLENVFSVLEQKENPSPPVFIKSWNEWGEGNYLEPDLRYGCSRLEALQKYLKG